MSKQTMHRVNNNDRGGKSLHQSGMSMVEILVSLFISLFLLGGVIQLFVSNKQAYRVQEGANLLHENGRYGLSFLGHSLRMADHWGGNEADALDKGGSLTATGIGNCSLSWITDTDVALQGFDGDSAIGSVSRLPTNCIPSADYMPDTDLLVVRYADMGAVSAVAGNMFVRSASGKKAVLGQVPVSGSPSLYGMSDQDGTANFPYKIEVWFIRKCSVQTGGTSATACDAGDDNGSPVPTLTRLTLEGSTLKQQAMVEGIENMQLEFGLDTDNDGVVDRFDTALSSPSSGTTYLNDTSDTASRKAGWRQVLSVRVALVARSPRPDASTSVAAGMILVGDQGQGSSGYTPPDNKYLRKQFTQTFQIRNRLRS